MVVFNQWASILVRVWISVFRSVCFALPGLGSLEQEFAIPSHLQECPHSFRTDISLTYSLRTSENLFEGVCLELTSSWPPARAEGRSRAVVDDTWSAGSADSVDSGDEFQTYDSVADFYQKVSSETHWTPNLQRFSRGSHKGPQGSPKGVKESPFLGLRGWVILRDLLDFYKKT